MDILKLNSIAKLADEKLAGYNLVDSSDSPLAILLRSYNMHEYNLPTSVIAIARAGAGVNNIPHSDYAKNGVCVFNTPGANANAVKELVICGMIMASRNVEKAINWASNLSGADVPKQVEKGKSQFGGTEIFGKTIAVLGLGAIGKKVAVACDALGMKVLGYDPYLSDLAKNEIDFITLYDDIASTCQDADFISLHMPMTNETAGFVNAKFMKSLKAGAIIINGARGELVNISDMKEFLSSKQVHKYVVDFPNADCIGVDGIIAIPHLGASTAEAEDNCAIMACDQIKNFIENGNIVNSVNLPDLSVEKSKAYRLSVISLEGTKLSIEGVSSTKNGICYTIIDSDEKIQPSTLTADGVLKIREIY